MTIILTISTIIMTGLFFIACYRIQQLTDEHMGTLYELDKLKSNKRGN